MERRWIPLAGAFVLGVAGFAFAIGLDELPGSSSWPGGPEIVVPIAVATTLAVVVALAWRLDGYSPRGIGTAILAAAVGFGLAWTGFIAVMPSGLDCGHIPIVTAEGTLDGNWSQAPARQGLEAHGLTVTYEADDEVEGETELADGTEMQASLLEPNPRGRYANASTAEETVRFRVDFQTQDWLGSSDEARDWIADNRERFEDRVDAFTADVEQATGWAPAGNVSWDEAMMVC